MMRPGIGETERDGPACADPARSGLWTLGMGDGERDWAQRERISGELACA